MSITKTRTTAISKIYTYLWALKAVKINLYLYSSNNPKRNLKNSMIQTDTKGIFILSDQIVQFFKLKQ